MVQTTTQYYSKLPDGYVIIENVPCERCDFCGEIYFSMSVMERVDEIIAAMKMTKDKVVIADFRQAA